MLDVGIGMCGSLLCSVLLAGFYIWQPDCLQVRVFAPAGPPVSSPAFTAREPFCELSTTIQ